ncbi:MAG: PRC-barrel domain-containing protein [Nitrospira sp. BO4]|nr:PRC-barrel domain-containing protein [Nitrospira sp. BO4]
MKSRCTERLHMKICGVSLPIMVGVVWLVLPNGVFAEGEQKPTSSKPSVEKQATDMTGGQPGLVEEYDVVPVPRGALVDDKGIALDQVVKNSKGETLGTIEKLMKDTKTGKIEYAVLQVDGTQHQLPLKWSQFKVTGGQLTLNATKEELQPSTNAAQAKDKSPDVSTYMEEIDKVRREPKPQGMPSDVGGRTGEATLRGSGNRQDAGATNPGVGPAVGSDFGTEAGIGSTGSTGSTGSSGGAGYGGGKGSSDGSGSGGK